MVKICPADYPEDSPYNERFAEYPYPLSAFQKWAIESIIEGNHVLVTAHTGSGKTLPAEFAIKYFTQKQKKIIYTSPIKALSNQKFYEFTNKYPEISFGLFTGDIKTNPNADVLIMTTEILMNYLYMQGSSQINDTQNSSLQFQIDINTELACVIFDEVHYINDMDRGQVWEQTILMLPKHIQIVMLSATIDNPAGFAEWVEQRGINESRNSVLEKPAVDKIVYLASTNHRVVPLTHYSYLTTVESIFNRERDKTVQQQIRDSTNCLLTLQTHGGQFQEKTVHKINELSKLFEKRNVYMKRQAVLNKLAEHLKINEMLPAIAFIFSRKNVEQCAHEITTNLLEDDSKVPYIMRRECEQIVRKFPNFKEYLELPEYNELVGLLEKGIGIHHSGMIPVLREIVELMISKKYIKLLFATESFAIGLDCPIKTAIFTSLTKFDGHSPRFLFSHEYTQMAGRAGRRGIDTVGHVIHCNQLFQNNSPSVMDYKSILSGKPQQLVSKFHIHYGIILNLLKNTTYLTNQSICKFVEKSMVAREIECQIGGIESEISVLEKRWSEKSRYFYDDNAATNLHSMTPTDCKHIIDLEKILSMLPQKKKKDAEKEIADLKSQYPTFEKDLVEYKEFIDISSKLEFERNYLLYKSEYIRNRVDDCLYILEKYEFIERKYSNEIIPPLDPLPDIVIEYYTLTPNGIQSAGLAEIHPLIGSFLVDKIRDFSVEQLIQLFICFTDIRVPEDYRIMYCSTKDMFLKNVLTDTNEFIEEIIAAEYDLRMNTGIDYDSMLNYDFTDEILGWVYADTEYKCKEFIQTIVYGKDISVGDFTKAILKISNIVKEFSVIAESSGNTELLFKLSQIDSLILKYVTTAQSLYV
jgi:superfamily II RNA helicase